MDSLAFLDSVGKHTPQPIYIVHGDEPFLKRLVLKALRRRILGDDPDGLGYAMHDGDSVAFSTVYNDLATVPFFSSHRLVVVEEADPFVTKERKKLEKYVDQPAPSGVLVLSVKTWTANTLLARKLPDAVISCDALKSQRLPQWSQQWCRTQHGKTLTADAAQVLVELTGTDMGLLDQELLKLAIFVGDRPAIEHEDVDRLVGNRRQQVVWSLFEFLGQGKTAEALALLNRLFEQGEDAPKLFFSAISFQLRRVALTAQLVEQGMSLPEAMTRAKVPDYPAARNGVQQQLRQLGRVRSAQLFDWLVGVNLAMITSNQLSPRILLERLIIQLSRPPALRS